MSTTVTFSLSGLDSDLKWDAFWDGIKSIPEGQTIFDHTVESEFARSLSRYLFDKVGTPQQALQKLITENLQVADTLIDREFLAYLEIENGVVRVDFSDWDPNGQVVDDMTVLTLKLEQFGR